MINTALVNKHTNKQVKDTIISAQAGIEVGLILTGYVCFFGLNTGALVIDLILAMCGF